MSAESWTLKGVDPKVRDEVRDAAAQAGLSIGEYLSRALQAEAGKDARDTSASSAIYRDASPGAGEVYQARRFGQRLDALEQRSQHTIAGVDRAIGMMDRTVLDLTQQIEATEAIAEDTAAKLAGAVERFRAAAETLGSRIDAQETSGAALRAAHDELKTDFLAGRAALGADIAGVAERVSDTESAAALLARNLSALEAGVDARIDDLTAHTLDLIGEGLAEARAAADAASLAADAAVSAALADVRAFEWALTTRLDAHETATQSSLDEARAESRAAHASLMQRIDACEGESEAALSDLAREFAHVVDTLNRDLAARLTELDATTKTALNAGVSEAHAIAENAAQRSEFAAADAVEALRAFHDAAEARIAAGERATRDSLDSALNEARALHAALSERLQDGEDETARVHRALLASVANVERDIRHTLDEHARAGRLSLAALAEDIERRAQENADAQFALRATMETTEADLRDRHDGVLAHLRLIDATLAAATPPAKFAALEAALAAHIERVALLETAQTELASAADVQARFAQIEDADLPGRIAAAVRLFEDKIAAVRAEAAADASQLAAETHALCDDSDVRLETALVGVRATLDQRLNALTHALASTADHANAAATTLVQAAADREAAARNSLAIELRALLDERDRRLSQELSQAGAHDDIVQRLDDMERRDAAAISRIGLELLAANERISQRIADVERRCVEAIQTIGEVVGQIDEKLNRRQDQISRTLAEQLTTIETQLSAGRRKQA